MKIYKIIASLLIVGAIFSMPMANAETPFTPDQVKNIEGIIKSYLVNNPEILVEASQALEAKQQANIEKQSLAGISQNKQAIFNDANSPVVGNANGTVTLVEFFDYQCGHCKAMSPIMDSLVKQDSTIKLVYKELPIFGGASRYASMAALASMKQGKYSVFHNALLQAEGPLSEESIMKIAGRVGLDVKKLKADMNAKEIDQQLRDNFRLAQSIKLVGTPTFIAGNKDLTKFEFIPGAATLPDLQKKLKNLL